MDYSLPGSSDHEISQARILEWVAISFSKDPFYSQINLVKHKNVGVNVGRITTLDERTTLQAKEMRLEMSI